MTAPDLPPVGATVADANGTKYRYTAKGWYVVRLDSAWPVADGSHMATLTALRRAEQRIKELELVEAEWRAAVAEASLPGTGSPNLSNPREWAKQQVALVVTLCEDRKRYKAELEKADAEIVDLHAQHSSDVSFRDEKIKRLTHRLATFEALAREARAMLATEAYRTAKIPAAHLLLRIAAITALATPGEDA